MVDLLNKKMYHSKFGEGIVISQNEKNIEVEFSSKAHKFPYPSAFEKFLIPEDESTLHLIQKEIAELKEAEILEKARKEADKKQKLQQQITLARQAAGYSDQQVSPRIPRIQDQPLTYLVSQGGSFDEECKNQFIWAPKYNKQGKTFHHWERLMDIRENDVIFHCSGGYIAAISRATGSCIDSERPCSNNVIGEEDWSNWEGRLVSCEYTVLKHPLKHGAFKEKIIPYCNGKYAAFNKMGTGNQGYLFELDKNLAAFFIKESAKKNPEILELEYIQFLLENKKEND